MDSEESLTCRKASHTERTWIHKVFEAMARMASRCAFEVLNVASRVVLPFLFWLAAGGVVLWLLFVPVAHDDQFPTLKVLSMSVGCVVGALGYCVVLEVLRPAGR